MIRAKQKFQPESQIFIADQVAARLGKGEKWFYENRRQLSAQGFPKLYFTTVACLPMRS